jgi:hypothetical protein
MLVDRHLARLELPDAFGIDVRANDVVPGFGETSSGYQADVATTDHRKIQGVLLKIHRGQAPDV